MKEISSAGQFHIHVPVLILFRYFPGFIKTRYFFLVWQSRLQGVAGKGGKEGAAAWSPLSASNQKVSLVTVVV